MFDNSVKYEHYRLEKLAAPHRYRLLVARSFCVVLLLSVQRIPETLMFVEHT